MFKIIVPEKFTAIVTYQAPGVDGVTGEFEAEFRYLPQEQVNIYVGNDKSTEELIDDLFIGWTTSLQDENGNPLQVNQDNREKLLALPGMKRAIRYAYLLAHAQGGPRLKNL